MQTNVLIRTFYLRTFILIYFSYYFVVCLFVCIYVFNTHTQVNFKTKIDLQLDKNKLN